MWVTDDLLETLSVLPDFHKILIYLARDTEYHESEVSTQRRSRCGMSWLDLSWPLCPLMGCIVASDIFKI